MKKRASKSGKSKRRSKTTRDLPVAKKSTSVRGGLAALPIDSYESTNSLMACVMAGGRRPACFRAERRTTRA